MIPVQLQKCMDCAYACFSIWAMKGQILKPNLVEEGVYLREPLCANAPPVSPLCAAPCAGLVSGPLRAALEPLVPYPVSFF